MYSNAGILEGGMVEPGINRAVGRDGYMAFIPGGIVVDVDVQSQFLPGSSCFLSLGALKHNGTTTVLGVDDATCLCTLAASAKSPRTTSYCPDLRASVRRAALSTA